MPHQVLSTFLCIINCMLNQGIFGQHHPGKGEMIIFFFSFVFVSTFQFFLFLPSLSSFRVCFQVVFLCFLLSSKWGYYILLLFIPLTLLTYYRFLTQRTTHLDCLTVCQLSLDKCAVYRIHIDCFIVFLGCFFQVIHQYHTTSVGKDLDHLLCIKALTIGAVN